MAQVTAPTNVSSWIDDYLDYLFNVLNDLPKIAAEWDTYEPLEQLDFVIEWDIKRDRLGQLEQWNEQRLLDADQQRRYRDLLQLLEERRMMLNALLAE